MKVRKNALGRGLSAILESPDTDITSRDISGDYVAGAIAFIPISSIEPNPFQPRQEIDPATLTELVQSIKEQGIIQPVTIRKLGFDKYQLIAGERRFRAASLAGLTEIPAFIRVANDEQMLELALIENIHRKDLNAIEIAISYQRLLEECHLTQEQLSEKVGINRATIANFIRLLRLPPPLQLALRNGEISMGHARALITVENQDIQLKILRDIIDKGLNVRDVESIVNKLQSPAGKNENRENSVNEIYRNYMEILSARLAKGTQITSNPKGKGKITIPFKDGSDFRRIIELLTREI